ncbi:MAG TPA: DNA replication and repair protein RecF [Gemmatimonadales bacterium]|nr:DNA replication and repair protein RecF [Gemmatimonadales bacterium]
MRLRRLVVRGFRNLADLEWEAPPDGVAILGANAQGKTNLLEAIYYPVLFRSLRGAADQEVLRFGEAGFRVEVAPGEGPVGSLGVTYLAAGRRKRIEVDGREPDRLAEAVGSWLAVAFQPTDVGLASGPAAERRQYLDRLLALADPRYLRALSRYRAALAQRNSALRQHRPELAEAFDRPLALVGAEVTEMRRRWAADAAEWFRAELECVGERAQARLGYRADPALGAPEGWTGALRASGAADRARGMTTVGPHRDDLLLEIGGRPLRSYGSTGQQRSAAVALKLVELATLRATRGTEPVLLLDDVFAELDRERQGRLARRLLGAGARQVFLTAPRRDELPAEMDLEVRHMHEGQLER